MVGLVPLTRWIVMLSPGWNSPSPSSNGTAEEKSSAALWLAAGPPSARRRPKRAGTVGLDVPTRSFRYISNHRRSDVVFPLIPALSLGERENGRQRLRDACTPGNVESLASILPLPKGEGRDEGEQAASP